MSATDTPPADAPDTADAARSGAAGSRIALVTGASRGLGFALAEALAPAYHVVAVARTVGGLEDLDDRIRARGGQATLAPMDICIPEAMAQLCRGIHDRWGHLDLWIHCAVQAPPLSPAPHVDARDLEKAVATNITATARLIQMVDPLLAAAPAPRAVFLDDPRAGQKFFAAYGATKAAQIALAASWQAETTSFPLDVRILTPDSGADRDARPVLPGRGPRRPAPGGRDRGAAAATDPRSGPGPVTALP